MTDEKGASDPPLEGQIRSDARVSEPPAPALRERGSPSAPQSDRLRCPVCLQEHEDERQQPSQAVKSARLGFLLGVVLGAVCFAALGIDACGLGVTIA